MSPRIPILVAALALLVAAGCGGQRSGTAPATGLARIHLTDSPAVYDSVILLIREVAIHRGGSDERGWEVVRRDEVGAYDLLQLQNGVFTTLGESLVPAGHYTQVRLLLADGSYVVQDGVVYPLTVPSGLQTGLKLTGEFDVPANGVVDLGLDFDAARSIHVTGSGKHMLKPTVRVLPMTLAGAITGQIAPEGVEAWAFAIAGDDTLSAAKAAADGRFTLSLLAAGTYSVALDAEPAYRDTLIPGVAVTVGVTTDLGIIELTPQ